MQRPLLFLGAMTLFAVGATSYAHIAQVQQRARMHAGVLRDIEREASEDTASKGPVCEGDVCNLAATRFRDPVTGKVEAS